MNVEPIIRWRKSSHSGHEGGDCVEVAHLSPMIAIRDSKDPDGPSLTLAHGDWRSLTQHIKSSAPPGI
ncbi:DUF397 domain-containing protein [Actinomadura viridis]|uniref:DUF397 domain-containing protein n=1 Tax=Actinomadura viridis TaxID=58110 RepID=A0A931GHP3_9ACTN|nr:DUF397 domain-containing protein [Actinomadura viridis]MBG6087560.1 hypothetical protein [Actinomadura viridis]